MYKVATDEDSDRAFGTVGPDEKKRMIDENIATYQEYYKYSLNAELVADDC